MVVWISLVDFFCQHCHYFKKNLFLECVNGTTFIKIFAIIIIVPLIIVTEAIINLVSSSEIESSRPRSGLVAIAVGPRGRHLVVGKFKTSTEGEGKTKNKQTSKLPTRWAMVVFGMQRFIITFNVVCVAILMLRLTLMLLTLLKLMWPPLHFWPGPTGVPCRCY